MTDLPDLTVTVPGDLRLPLARLLVREPVPAAFRGIDLTTLPSVERLRLAADLSDPDAAEKPVTAGLNEDERRVVDGYSSSPEATYVDQDGDTLVIHAMPRNRGRLRVRVDPDSHDPGDGYCADLSLEHQRRLHALLTANLAKHVAL